ncbi:MAG: polysaccharide deacetylase [Nitrospirae bacterium RBG_13_39_12]|nr:MAG: polysaccharide deacetylase [Nitrospirae bacterium RBG_13_39_12]
MRIILSTFSMLILLNVWITLSNGETGNTKNDSPNVPVLIYHRFGPVVADNMTVTTNVFESQIKYLIDNGYEVIPLRKLVDYYLKKGHLPSGRLVVITADDGHKSVYTDMLPIVKKYHIPVTLFLYPSAISNAPYAMTWEQLREIKKTGFFDFQSHSYWHPNFKKERTVLKPDEYEKFVNMQFKKSKEKLEKELGTRVDFLAWPFGIYNDELIFKAVEAGYIAGFTMERRHTSNHDNIMLLPRYLMTDSDKGNKFGRILAGKPSQRNSSN